MNLEETTGDTILRMLKENKLIAISKKQYDGLIKVSKQFQILKGRR